MVPYIGDFAPGQLVHHYFNTFSSDDPSASVTMTNFINTDVHIHRDVDLTQRNNAAGITIDVDLDAITGTHSIKIDLADNTVADFFISGHDYLVRIEGTTIDGATVNAGVFSFSIDNRQTAGKMVATNIATLASQVSFTLDAGSADDNAYNNCIAIVTDIASAVQKCIGRISDYTGSTKTITLVVDPGIFTMAAGDNIVIVGPAAGVSADVWDRILTGSTHNIANSAGRRLRQAQEAGGYTNGAVYIDTVGGTAGTTNFENGVDSNQVDSIADANTIASSVGLSLFRMAPNSSITFTATQDGEVFSGSLWTLALGGQSINETHIIGAEVSGTCTGHAHLDHCHLAICSFAQGEFTECGLADTFTMTGAANYIFYDCYHEEAGAPSTLDFGSAVGASEVHIHGWKGNLLVRNMDTGDILHFSSAEGTLTLDSSNTAGTANLTGTFGFTNNSSGMTINDNGQIYQRIGAPVGAHISADIAAIKSVVGALNDAAAADDVTTADTLMQYIKQLLNELSGSVGIGTMPAAADPANGINLFEVSRRMFDDTNAIEPITTALTSAAAAKLALTMGASPDALVDTTAFVTTTTEFESDGITTAAADHFIGRIILFTTGTGILDEQATDITDYAVVGGRGHFTYTALTSAPADNAPFIII